MKGGRCRRDKGGKGVEGRIILRELGMNFGSGGLAE